MEEGGICHLTFLLSFVPILSGKEAFLFISFSFSLSLIQETFIEYPSIVSIIFHLFFFLNLLSMLLGHCVGH